MSPSDSTSRLEEQVQRLEQVFHSEMEERRRVSRSARMVTVLLIAVVGFFLVLNYLHLRSEWTEEKFSQSLELGWRELQPTAMAELRSLAGEVLPVYADEAQRQLQARLPELSTKIRGEIDQLSAEVLQQTDRKLAETERRVIDRTEQEILASFPGLADSAQKEELARRLHDLTEEATLAAITEFDTLFRRDVESVKTSLLNFDLRDTDESLVDLHKKAIRLWLRLLEEEINAL